MNIWLSTIISKIKKSPYKLDPDIEPVVLASILLRRSLMALRGFFSGISHKKILFLGPKCTIRCRSKISAGKYVTIDEGCFIDALSKEGVTLGDNVSLNKWVVIECTGNLQHLGKGLYLEEGVGVGHHTFFGCAGGIRVMKDTIIGNFVSFHSENHVFSDKDIPIKNQGVTHKGITIGPNCWIGAKVTILDGVYVHEGCVIAAGALLTSGVYEPNGIYGGVPAKKIGTR